MFITLEGIEGSGKTTQVQAIRQFLENRHIQVAVTREPGGTAVGAKIRAILLDPGHKEIDPLTELLLYTADRAQHIRQVIRPMLAQGKTVLCDRFFDATLVYQGVARGLDITCIRTLHSLMCAGLTPDLTLLFDLPPEQGLARAWQQIGTGQRSGGETRFEEETIAFHRKVRAGYLELADREPERFRVIDAARSKEDVRDGICLILADVLDRTCRGRAQRTQN